MEQSLLDYLDAVNDLLETIYGVSINDGDMELVASRHDDVSAPEECVELIAGKYGLISMVQEA